MLLMHRLHLNWGCLDNEYSQNGFGHREYFQELIDKYRDGGIVVPLTYNDPGQGKNFVNGTVSVWYITYATMRLLRSWYNRDQLIYMGTQCSTGFMICIEFNCLVSLDSYPQGFDCSNPETWRPVVENYHDYHIGTLIIQCIPLGIVSFYFYQTLIRASLSTSRR